MSHNHHQSSVCDYGLTFLDFGVLASTCSFIPSFFLCICLSHEFGSLATMYSYL